MKVEQRAIDAPLARWPLTLNTGRYRDQWHTMTRTGLSPRLSQHRREPAVEVHPADAAALGLTDGELARVMTPQGESVFRVIASDSQRRGEVFVPIHWTDRQSSGGRTGFLARGQVDPHSGQPGFKQVPARIEPQPVDWRGFAVLREPPRQIAAAYATRVRVPRGWLVELAGVRDPGPLVERLLPAGERLESLDPARGVRRSAVLHGAELQAAIYLTRTGPLPNRDWIIAQLGDCTASPRRIARRPSGQARARSRNNRLRLLRCRREYHHGGGAWRRSDARSDRQGDLRRNQLRLVPPGDRRAARSGAHP